MKWFRRIPGLVLFLAVAATIGFYSLPLLNGFQTRGTLDLPGLTDQVTVQRDVKNMVADLSDNEKIIAVLPGGIAGRTFHPHQKDQVKGFMSGEKRYWWFSDQAIDNHAVSMLVLSP